MMRFHNLAERSSNEVSETEPSLPDELLLREYQPSENPQERMALFRQRDNFRQYWEEMAWLNLDFEKGEPCIRATHFVGLMPFRCGDSNHLIMVAPKGCSFDTPEKPVGLLRFLDLLAVAHGIEPIEEPSGFSGKLGRNFFVFLAEYYSRLLHDLCRLDYRRCFEPEEQELHSRVRGRIHIAGHIRNALRGREHRIPCRWEEFTDDNWDNRILLGTIRRLEQGAALLAPEAGRYVTRKFSGLQPWFSSVQEVPIRPADFSKARLGRTSRYYRNALAWARLVIQGLDRPVAGIQAPSLIINANHAFQQFAAVVAQSAVNRVSDRNWEVFAASLTFFRECRPARDGKPDLAIRSRHQTVAVGDAKYKDILNQSLSQNQLGDLQDAIVPSICPADWNQLYVYMRLAEADHGFFVVPFWNAAASAAQLITDLEFEVSPLDRAVNASVRIAVVGLNLLQPLNRVRDEAAKQLSEWLCSDAP